MIDAVILLSGGIDSATVLAMLSDQKMGICALSFDYSQRHRAELERSKLLASFYKVKMHKIVKIDPEIFQGSALADPNIQVPKYSNAQEIGEQIPLSYVPARNLLFLSYAASVVESLNCRHIYLGVHSSDAANYPDCRKQFIHSFEHTVNLATAMGVKGETIYIHAPLIDMTKAQIVAKGIELGLDYSMTSSCYDPIREIEACGECHACLIRLAAFSSNSLQDPVKYSNKS